MLQVNYLDGFIYHMVHVTNLHSIFQQQALLSQELLTQRGIEPHSIAFESVQHLRDRISIWDFYEQRFRSLHRYVPFYFAIHPPMLYSQLDAGRQEQIVILEVKRIILKERGVLFTDGNATNQQLSQMWEEQVKIVPVTVLGRLCQRQYTPDGPYGTNQNCSNFYANLNLLGQLNWGVINGDGPFIERGEYLRIRSAEVLIPNSLSIANIVGIAVKTLEMVQVVNTLIAEWGLIGRIPFATLKRSLFL